MTPVQKAIKYFAVALAVLLTVGILGGILGVLGLLDLFTGGSAVDKSAETYTVSSDIRCVEIDIGAAEFTVKQGDGLLIESNIKKLKVEERGGVLRIKETEKLRVGSYADAFVTLYIPAGTVFDEMNITAGAGSFTAERLAADTVDIELDAGEVSIGTLIAERGADIDCGAGEISISDGQLRDLDLDMGTGRLTLVSALSGECEIDGGVGEADITVIGSRSDYRLELEKGIGSISVDGEDVSGSAQLGSGNNSIDISGGVGEISLRFANAA